MKSCCEQHEHHSQRNEMRHRNDFKKCLYQDCASHNQQTVKLLRKHECRSDGFTDAHMASPGEILAPLLAEEDVVVRRRKRTTTLRTGGRRVLVAVVADPQSLLQSSQASLI